MNLLDFQRFHLVGIKGVAMTALAQCLVDAGKTVTGSDVAEEFVTQELLIHLNLPIQTGFDEALPVGTECVIYTSAHNAHHNPQVLQAKSVDLPIFSHAEALGSLFNQKLGVAVCGVGGKSTTSAMITWILEKSQVVPASHLSFAIGVGNIPGLNKTGQWSATGKYFIAEADEYVTDPNGARNGDNFVPRFSYLKPQITVCTNLKFDHPDVYRDFDHTKQIYREFFLQLKPGGYLVINGDDTELWTLAKEVIHQRPDIKMVTYGETSHCDLQLSEFTSAQGISKAILLTPTPVAIHLRLPGIFNMMNAVAALAATSSVVAQSGVGTLSQLAQSLSDFRSTKRRSEFIAEKHGVKYYDDYAHHPNEVAHIIQAFRAWYPEQRVVIGFQSHTYSRTKQLFDDFVDALGQAQEVVMIDIFASARESDDPTVSSDTLCAALRSKYPTITCVNVHTIDNFAEWCREHLQPGDVLVTVGAGDIYKVHELL